jgi:hypothetical protein
MSPFIIRDIHGIEVDSSAHAADAGEMKGLKINKQMEQLCITYPECAGNIGC